MKGSFVLKEKLQSKIAETHYALTVLVSSDIQIYSFFPAFPEFGEN